MTPSTRIAAVTGATGFVGKHLIRALVAQGYKVRALTRRPQPHQPNITWIKGDLGNHAALSALVADADIIFHLAGLIKAKSTRDFHKVNSDSVTTLLDLLKERDQKPHFILLSSLAARERHLSSYANSKRCGEENLTENAHKVPWTIIRPPGVYGPEDMETLKIFKAVSNRIAPIPADRYNRASWIFAPDLAQALIAVSLNKACYGRTLDVDDGKDSGYSMEDLYQTAASTLDIRPLQITLPKFLLKIGAYGNVLFSTIFRYTPMLTPEKINELCFPDWICHGTHVMKITDWSPGTSLEKGLEITLTWYKENNLI